MAREWNGYKPGSTKYNWFTSTKSGLYRTHQMHVGLQLTCKMLHERQYRIQTGLHQIQPGLFQAQLAHIKSESVTRPKRFTPKPGWFTVNTSWFRPKIQTGLYPGQRYSRHALVKTKHKLLYTEHTLVYWTNHTLGIQSLSVPRMCLFINGLHRTQVRLHLTQADFNFWLAAASIVFFYTNKFSLSLGRVWSYDS